MESVTTENKNMKEALTKARNDNEELQEEVVLKEVKTFFCFCVSAFHYITQHIYLFGLSNWMKHVQITWIRKLNMYVFHPG